MSDSRTPQPIHYGRCPRCRGFYSSEGRRRVLALRQQHDPRFAQSWACGGGGAVVDDEENIRHMAPEAGAEGVVFFLYKAPFAYNYVNALKIVASTCAPAVVFVAVVVWIFSSDSAFCGDDWLFFVEVFALMAAPGGIVVLMDFFVDALVERLFFSHSLLPRLELTPDRLRWGEEEVSFSTIEAVEERGRFLLIHTSDDVEHCLEPIGGPHLLRVALDAARGLGEGIGTIADVPEVLRRREALHER